MGDKTQSISMKVVEKVAEREGVDPLDIPSPLHDAIDPDAMESLVSAGSDSGDDEGVRMEFTYCEYEITVDGGEVIILDE